MTLRNLSPTLLSILSVATHGGLVYTNLGGSPASAASPEICPTMFADFNRRQLEFFESDKAFGIEEGTSLKHIPFLTLSDDGKIGTVVVGNGDEEGGVWHPMVASEKPEYVHFITHIMVKDQDDKIVALESMDPTAGAPAKMEFAIPAGVSELTPINWCNLHGMWTGPAVKVSNSEERSDVVCGVSNFPNKAWESVHADYERLQSEPPHNSTVPFSEDRGEKHTPFITLNGDGTASILVGRMGGSMHPMTGSPDGIARPHWIQEIYVMDQFKKIVAMESLDSGGVDYATMTFNVPKGATSLQAYAWCNIHGLWTGPPVEVENNNPTGAVSGSKDSAAASFTGNLGATLGASLLTAISMWV